MINANTSTPVVILKSRIKEFNASDFAKGTTVYIKSSDELIYSVKIDGLRSHIMCEKTFKLLSCTPGVRGGWPYYLYDFLSR